MTNCNDILHPLHFNAQYAPSIHGRQRTLPNKTRREVNTPRILTDCTLRDNLASRSSTWFFHPPLRGYQVLHRVV